MREKGFVHLVLIIIGIAVFVIAALIILLLSRKITRSGDSGNCQSNPSPIFTTDFTDLEKISNFRPLGSNQAGSTGRGYMVVKDGMEAPIYSPADAILETIIYAPRGPDTPAEYGLYFKVSCEVTFLFDHIDKISDKIKEFAPKEPANSTRTELGTHPGVVIKKGELLGYSDGTPLAHTFDFLLMNKSKSAPRINQKRWTWEQALYSQCPYDYFTKELKDKYYAKIGDISRMSGVDSFIPVKDCGGPSHDTAGTASGGWFKGDSTDYKGDYLAVNKYLETVEVTLRKDGNREVSVSDYSPKVWPQDIKAGNEVCYQDSNGNMWAYVKLISENQLTFAKGFGSCPASFPKDFDTWER